MRRAIIFIPTDTDISLINILSGIAIAAKNTGMQLCIFTPISSIACNAAQESLPKDTAKYSLHKIIPDFAIPMSRVKTLLQSDQIDILMEEIVAHYSDNTDEDTIILVEGLSVNDSRPWALRLNQEMANTLNAEIVFVTTIKSDESLSQIQEKTALIYASLEDHTNIAGIIINCIDYRFKNITHFYQNTSHTFKYFNHQSPSNIDIQNLITTSKLPILGYIPWSVELLSPLSIDIFHYLNATAIQNGDSRRITAIIFCSQDLTKIIEHLPAGSLLVISAERLDLFLTAYLAATEDTEISGIILTGNYAISLTILQLCKRAFPTGLPIFQVMTDTLQTAQNLQKFIREKSTHGMQNNCNTHTTNVARHISTAWITSLQQSSNKINNISPAAFRYQLTQASRLAGKRIILPEGDEPRIIQAASIAAERGMATCILLGNKEKIQNVASELDITLGTSVQILEPIDIRENYIHRLVELRKHKGMTTCIAQKQLEDNTILATMILERGEVDGLVSGVRNTTANTIRPALQLIKTAQNNLLVSSVFFMLLPQQVLVYSDCAINTNPNAQELAEIAIQSADSALAFGIEPRVAMISYSTGDSGSGKDIDKIKEATRIACAKRPDLLIDGPLQYDAAIMMDVAKSKAPYSPVAGKATVFVFPDLNTGNTTYKAVQRAANINSIGPMLQGMRKPVNDLSRGALVKDILYTIALTAIQASKLE
ncbi:Phosphate acetyltransferase [Candidatus Erwinia haradaeae]|uniref:Phosphate acetyltransferase n=1 Tax=Candidatus Erwinia haradaeae TaxID=1922217 RepID=A0A451DCD4_9GAMM|nr:phosphate acetyltransferase [Candidatus Erwinia haradaeae]VFP84004.1 Phosphate acetyltransferase [Candidatus Erwinia haradaeae]